MRYILLDRITEVVVGERARGIKCVTLSDQVLHDHFPDFPVFPGALTLEAAAQLAGFLLEVSAKRAADETPPRRAILVQIEKAKFYRPIVPGDTIELSAQMDGELAGASRARIEASVAGERAMRGTLMFVLRQIESERVHEQRRYLYSLWTRDLKVEIPVP